MKTYQRRTSVIEGFELLKEFARAAEHGHIPDHAAAVAFMDVARQVLVFVDQIDGRRKLSRADLACAVVKLARSTPETWGEALKEVSAQAKKLEKQLGAIVQKQDPFFFESSFEL